MDTYWLLGRHSGAPYRAVQPDRRSSAFGGALSRRTSALSVGRSSAFSVGRSSAATTASSGASEHLSSIAVDARDIRAGSRRSGAGSFRGAVREEEDGSVRRLQSAPAGTEAQLTEGEEAL